MGLVLSPTTLEGRIIGTVGDASQSWKEVSAMGSSGSQHNSTEEPPEVG